MLKLAKIGTDYFGIIIYVALSSWANRDILWKKKKIWMDGSGWDDDE